MKKIVVCLLFIVMVFFSAVTTGARAVTVQVDVKGDGEASYTEDGDTITFIYDEKTVPFVFWDVHGEYEIISGDYTLTSFTVYPLSNIEAVAVCETAMPHTVIPATEKPPDELSTSENKSIVKVIFIVWIFIFGGIMIGNLIF